MVPLKQGCRGVWGVWYLGCVGVLWHKRAEKKGTPTWDNTYQMKLHMLPTLLWGGFGPCRGLVELSFLVGIVQVYRCVL